MIRLTNELISAGFSDAGGVTRRQLDALGVQYPPKVGWKNQLIGVEISQESYDLFLSLRNTSKKMQQKQATGDVYETVFAEMREFWMDNMGCEATKIMARFVCSCYWGGERVGGYLFDLKTLDSLDTKNFENCLLIARYRRSAGWSDDKFYALAMFAKTYATTQQAS